MIKQAILSHKAADTERTVIEAEAVGKNGPIARPPSVFWFKERTGNVPWILFLRKT